MTKDEDIAEDFLKNSIERVLILLDSLTKTI